MDDPHDAVPVFRCMRCTLMARIASLGRSSTWTGSRSKGVPACPQCGAHSWIDPTSFTAYYRKLSPNVHTCVVGPHEDPSVTHVVLDATTALPEPTRDAMVLVQISAGLCTEHLAVVRSTGIGTFRVADPD